jgi:hypothetical protein
MLGIGPALRASAKLFAARPVVTLSLGAAVVLSLISVCCGIGVFTTPWFMCELFALQLSESGGKPVVRQSSWLAAGGVMLGAVLLVASVAWLTLLGASPELDVIAPQSATLSSLMASGAFFAVLGSAIAVLFILPFLYAPLTLIEERSRFDAALLESVRRVAFGGVLAHVRFSLFAHALQVAPAGLAALLALLMNPGALPMFVLCSTPLLCATVPLGQGMIVCAYVHAGRRRVGRVKTEDVSPRIETVRVVTGRYTFYWLSLVLVALVSVVALGASLVRPSRLVVGQAPSGTPVATLSLADAKASRAVIEDTALEVSVDGGRVRVRASDGGGAGVLPLRSTAPITAVHVVRVRDAYAIEVQQAELRSLAYVDRAGVRLDDDLRARLLDRVPGYAVLLMLFTLLCTALLTLPVLAGLSRVRRGHELPGTRRPSDDLLALDLQRSLRRARQSALLLSPLLLASGYFALRGFGAL